ncbi:FAD-dependent oxidoreductase [Alkalihalobacillus hemicellulosilyticus]|uniref:Thioredoxin reductase n=1 Tax=Halalkalibacter hemicellulosilyticusJCM 9152 TaxID=1236971 RepID=W4QGU8_9BACI|nr:FAD-dependent oxidoreductase [Halalkalibacter hemicellulosilyticus]GAE30554.1 thioredoxin reductase [Halalkalibacter hemicellulosilyticusJCM 9152]
MSYEIAIIGAGPAGASAALFAAKAGKKTLLLDHGKSMTARAWVENHYGVDGIEGPKLLELGKEQATKFGADLKEEEVLSISEQADEYVLETANGTYLTKHVILATGAIAQLAEKSGIATKEGSEPRIKQVVDVDASGKTKKERIWAAGTVADQSVHTIITAGDGAKVAINVISELNGERYVDHDVLKA